MKSADDAFVRGQQLLEQRRFAEAEALARSALAEEQSDGRLWQLAGIASWALGAVVRARADLETAGTLAPLCPMAWLALADCYVGLRQHDAARGIYRMLADHAAFPTSLLPRLATGLGRIEEYRAALKVCRTLACREPRHHAAFFGMAYYLSRLGYPQRSVLARLRQAFRLAPDMLLYRVNLACVYADLGRIRAAHGLIRDLNPLAIPCPCWLRRLVRIFDLAQDHAHGETFGQVLALRLQAE